MRRLLVTASVVPNSPILVTLMKEALSSSETSVLYKSNTEDAMLLTGESPLVCYIPYSFPVYGLVHVSHKEILTLLGRFTTTDASPAARLELI
jgi:hypothetical protein